MLQLIFQEETDGEIKIQSFPTTASVRRFVFNMKLGPNDYAIIEGKILKSFDNKTFTEKGKHLCLV